MPEQTATPSRNYFRFLFVTPGCVHFNFSNGRPGHCLAGGLAAAVAAATTIFRDETLRQQDGTPLTARVLSSTNITQEQLRVVQASLRSTHDTGRQATATLVEAQGRAEQAQQEYGRLHRIVTAVNPRMEAMVREEGALLQTPTRPKTLRLLEVRLYHYFQTPEYQRMGSWGQYRLVYRHCMPL